MINNGFNEAPPKAGGKLGGRQESLLINNGFNEAPPKAGGK